MASGKQGILLCTGPVSQTVVWKWARGCGQDHGPLGPFPYHWHLATLAAED